jgi:Sec-independent protein translocase protein TatA
VGFGIEILFVLMLGLLILGPKRLHTILLHVSQAKAQLENATRGLKSQLAAELNATRGSGKNDCSHVLVGDCELCSTFKSVPESREPAEDALLQSSV